MPLLLHLSLCKRITAHRRPCFAASETGCHDVKILLLEPVQECTEEQIMQVPVLQIIEIFRNHMPVLYVALRIRPLFKESVEVPNIQVVVGALFWNFGSTHRTPAPGYTYWAHAQGLVLAQISSSEIVALAQKLNLSGTESRHEPWSCREPGNPLLVVGCQPNATSAHMGASVWLLLPRRDRFSSLVVSSRYVSTFSSSP